jgi:hypothetical protein
MTDKLFHFVSLIFYNDLIFNLLSRNLVSSVSFVSQFCETKQAIRSPSARHHLSAIHNLVILF